LCTIGAIHPPPIEVGVFLHFMIKVLKSNNNQIKVLVNGCTGIDLPVMDEYEQFYK